MMEILPSSSLYGATMPALNSGVRRFLLKIPSGRPDAKKVGDLLRRFAAPVGIAESDHVVDRPGIVGDHVGQHEARDALRMIDGHDEGDAAARVVADEVRALDAEMIHQPDDHGGLSEQGAVEEVAPVGIAVAEEIRRDDPGRLGEQRYHLIVEKRPGRNSVQQDDRLAFAEIGLSDAQRSCSSVRPARPISAFAGKRHG